ncbi:UNVERIFIED_CONTAM: hypothetical protein HDU68_003389 [Siphonaria sp. JEL0065]|nr:hypothetical protein HDU68_003389 [Siphonaria sp. JEL0065]
MQNTQTAPPQPKKRFSFRSSNLTSRPAHVAENVPSSVTATPPATDHQSQQQGKRVSVLHPNPHLSVSLQHPPTFAEKIAGSSSASSTQDGSSSKQDHLIHPSHILLNPSMLTHSPPTHHEKHHHHESNPLMAPQSTQQHRPSQQQHPPTTAEDFSGMDSFTLLSKLAEMFENGTSGGFPSNRKILQLIKMTWHWIYLLEESRQSQEDGGNIAVGGCSQDGLEVFECLKQSLTRVQEFIVVKNEGELLQNVVMNLQIAVAKDGEMRAEIGARANTAPGQVLESGSNGDGMQVKKDDVVQAFKDLLTLMVQLLINKNAMERLVQMLRIMYSMLIGPVATHKSADDSSATPSVAASSSQDTINAASQNGSVEEEIFSGCATHKDTPKEPTEKPKPLKSTIAVPREALGDVFRVLAPHLLPQNVIKGAMTASAPKNTPSGKISSKSSLAQTLSTIESRVLESNEKTSTNDNGTPAQDFIEVLTALWNSEKDADSIQLREQMVKLLKSVEILYRFGEHFFKVTVNAEETPGRGNLVIAIDLGLKFLQRFVKTPITPLKNALIHLNSLLITDIIPNHGPCIYNMFQHLKDAFISSDLALSHPEKLHKVAFEFRNMVDSIDSGYLPAGAESDGESELVSDGSVGIEVSTVTGVVKNVWEDVRKDDFLLGVSEDGGKWWNALFVDGDGGAVVKLSLWRDFSTILLPAILVDFKTLEIPKLEYTENKYKFELENLEINFKGMLPSLCKIKVENEVFFGFDKQVAVEYSQGVIVELFQMCIQMDQIPFKAERSGCIRLAEEGFMDVLAENRGITLAVHVALDSNATSANTILVKSVNVMVQDLEIRIYGTRNDAIYRVFEKAMAKKVSKAIKESVEQELKVVIEKWDGTLTQVKKLIVA